MSTGGTQRSGLVSPRRLVESVISDQHKRYAAQRAKQQRQARARQAEIVRIIAKSYEMFGRQPTNKQLAEMIGVSEPTISKYRKQIRERLSKEPCPLCGTRIDGPKI